MDSDSELKLISLFTQLKSSMIYPLDDSDDGRSRQMQNIIRIISLVSSLDFESQPKPESEFMSLIVPLTFLFNSMDLEMEFDHVLLPRLRSLFTQLINGTVSDSYEDELFTLLDALTHVDPKPELVSHIDQILSLVVSGADSKDDENLIFLRCRARASLEADFHLHITREIGLCGSYFPFRERKKFRIAGEGASSYIYCGAYEVQIHDRYTNEIKHPLHPKHSLQLFSLENDSYRRRKCYCCDQQLGLFIFCCLACDFAMNMDCVAKPLVLSIDCPKWHEHPLALFSRTTSLICDVCALVDSTGPVYICPPCGFVVHQRCFGLPRVIRISRHPRHRISFTPCFNQGNLSCGVCRKGIHGDYGGYSCIKKDCSYAAHSRCATRSSIWDGEDLEGVPEENVEDVESFVRISNGIIQHFSHQEHHLRLDENTDRDFDENKFCQACITPIYSGKLYACLQCDYILHEECANLSRKMYHPVHPHLLTLVQKVGNVEGYDVDRCSVCPWFCKVGLVYECPRGGCSFRVHVRCGVVSEPLLHASHPHPLFLTSEPGEERYCYLCTDQVRLVTSETFNCIECNFSLCFGCATLPQKVRYKHDKHMFILSYEEETSTLESWCEACEGKINMKKGFYMCEEDCCITLHVKCVVGDELYFKPGSSWFYHFYSPDFEKYFRVDVLPKQQMTRPICPWCQKRCPNASLKVKGLIFCSTDCMYNKIYYDL